MRTRTRLLTIALAVTALVPLGDTVATAAPATAGHHYGASNYLRGYCDDLKVAHRCVDNFDDGYLGVRDAHGHLHAIGDEEDSARNLRLIVRFVTAHSHPCREEGDNHCTWNAHTQGNGYGRSYFVIGDSSVIYYNRADMR